MFCLKYKKIIFLKMFFHNLVSCTLLLNCTTTAGLEYNSQD